MERAGRGEGHRPAHVLEVTLHCSKLTLQAADVCLLLHHSLLQSVVAWQLRAPVNNIFAEHHFFGCKYLDSRASLHLLDPIC